VSFSEEVMQFDCDGERLLGVLCRASDAALDTRTAVLVVVGGPQYRAGSHRQFVLLARTLAAHGHAVLRFDRRGMGDSSGALRSFEDMSEDVEAALRALRTRLPQLRRIVLFGLCDGAAAALLCLQAGNAAGVDGLCLANPWARSDHTLALAHVKHYYSRRLFDIEFWRKLFRGQIGIARVRELGVALRRTLFSPVGLGGTADRPPFQHAMAMAWRRFKGPILLVLSDEDLTAKEFLEHAGAARDWRGLLDLPSVTRVDIGAADHTFSTRSAQEAFESAMLTWLTPIAATASSAVGYHA
jgi:exosortase A-associated hydrolase 1